MSHAIIGGFRFLSIQFKVEFPGHFDQFPKTLSVFGSSSPLVYGWKKHVIKTEKKAGGVRKYTSKNSKQQTWTDVLQKFQFE